MFKKIVDALYSAQIIDVNRTSPVNREAYIKRIKNNTQYKPSAGDIVEVFREGEGKWVEGEVNDVDDKFEVKYVDGTTLWHDSHERIRLKL